MSIILQPPAFSTKISVFLRNRGPESDLGLHSSALVSEIFEFYTFWKMHYVDQDVVVTPW